MKIITKIFSIIALSTLLFTGCNNQSETLETEELHHEEAESMVELTPSQ